MDRVTKYVMSVLTVGPVLGVITFIVTQRIPFSVGVALAVMLAHGAGGIGGMYIIAYLREKDNADLAKLENDTSDKKTG